MPDMPKDPTGLRYYGGDGTVHATEKVDVELDKRGNVVAVWFRCQMLPFTQRVVDDRRAADLSGVNLPDIDAIVFRRREA